MARTPKKFPSKALANLSPKPTTPAKLKKVASEFVDLAAYKEPEPWMTHGFIFGPAGSVKAPKA